MTSQPDNTGQCDLGPRFEQPVPIETEPRGTPDAQTTAARGADPRSTDTESPASRTPAQHTDHLQPLATPGDELARIAIGGVTVDLCDEKLVLAAVEARLTDVTARPLVVGSANLDHLHYFGPTGRLRHAIADDGDLEWLVLADGYPVAKRGRQLTGLPWPRLTGADLLEPMLHLAEEGGHAVGFLGGGHEMHGALQSAIADNFTGLHVVGYWTPDRAILSDVEACAALAAEVRAAGVEVLVVGLGKPRQEVWIVRHGIVSGARVMLPFGAAVDFMAGRVNRAPAWMSSRGLEWLYRLALEPRRLARRYLVRGPVSLLQLRHARVAEVKNSALFEYTKAHLQGFAS